MKTTKTNEPRTVELPFSSVIQNLLTLAARSRHGAGMDVFIFWAALKPDKPIGERLLLLGIARLAGKGKRYIKMFAGREEIIEDDAYSLDYEGAYSYMAVKEKIKAPEETKHYPRKKKKEEESTLENKPEEEKNGVSYFQIYCFSYGNDSYLWTKMI
jgi:hypothetical protein